MTLTIITHVPHILEGDALFASGPYVREMNIWCKYADRVILVAPQTTIKRSGIHVPYDHPQISFRQIPEINFQNIPNIVKSVLYLPVILYRIGSAMRQGDHIHLRCPGNIGLLGCLMQLFFRSKPKTAKYAGNWDPRSRQPLSYRFQKWLLANEALTRNMKVLVYGQWPGSSRNIYPFFTATYFEADKSPVSERSFDGNIRLLFVGRLSKAKNPIYVLKLVSQLQQKGLHVVADLYGEGVERNRLERYIHEEKLENVTLHGNQSVAVLREAYQSAHMLILPSESEGWPKAVAEAMFWGCVPAASAVSCVPVMLANERGIVLSLNEESDAEQLARLLTNKDSYKHYSVRAANWSRYYTLDLFENEIKTILSR